MYSAANRTLGIRAIGDRIRLHWFAAACICCFSAAAAADGFDLQRRLTEQQARADSLSDGLDLLLKRQPENGGGTLGANRQMLLPPGQNPMSAQLAQADTVVFVSRAMPEAELLKLLVQGAGRKGTVFLYRGWGTGGADSAFAYAEALLRKLPPAAQRNPPQIMVLPAAFRRYRIAYAPAVLHRDGGKWYLVQGAGTLDNAVAAVKRREFNRRLSRQWRVSEPDQTEVIKAAAARFDWKGAAEQAAQSAAQQLEGGTDLPLAQEVSSRLYTPYSVTGFDIRDPQSGRVLYPRGSRFNVLTLDPQGSRSLVAVDGRDERQVRYAQRIVRERPQTVVLYTRLGRLAGAVPSAFPLNPTLIRRLGLRSVPSYLQQQGTDWRIVSAPPAD
ncbi:TrbC family F-type conjugative pilus assembly protein [Neisseria bacilliformis]|nr:TrbC family F-type conjugative pilus assembly protein [Neisseria bacilliformis]QMT47432.1 hypothetical protein H3L91_11180 [Neisseria bacilliformis]